MKTFAIYAGRFQPFHIGHKSVYDGLVNKFGADSVFITMTPTTEPTRSPFSFEDRKQMMEITGIPADKIKEVSSNYNLSIISQLIPINVHSDAILFAISDKDMVDEPRFKSFVKKDGSPTYIQKYPQNQHDIQPAVKHGYLLSVPVKPFTVLGKTVSSSTELRGMFSTLPSNEKIEFIKDLFGRFDKDILNIMQTKITNQLLREHIKSILMEDFDEDIAKLVKKRDTLDYQVEQLRLKKAGDALRTHIENMKTIQSSGGDMDAAKVQLDNLKKEWDASKKRVSAANVKKSA